MALVCIFLVISDVEPFIFLPPSFSPSPPPPSTYCPFCMHSYEKCLPRDKTIF